MNKYKNLWGLSRNEILKMPREEFAKINGAEYLEMSPSKFIKIIKQKAKLKHKHISIIDPSISKLHRVWQGIKQRCLNKQYQFYKDYGGRGITICNEWLNFINFKNDMHESYLKHIEHFGEKNTQIDREDNNGNYNKNNCRWATRKEQTRNTRRNRFITYKGQTKTIAEWAEMLEIKHNIIRYGFKKGWSMEKIINEKKDKEWKHYLRFWEEYHRAKR